MQDILTAVPALRMEFRIAGGADAEIIRRLPEFPDQFNSVPIVPGAAVRILQRIRDIASIWFLTISFVEEIQVRCAMIGTLNCDRMFFAIPMV